MRLRRISLGLVVAAAALAGCAGSDDAAISVEEPIGAPAPVPTLDDAPSVAKSARVEMDVARADLAEAAQAVVDLATSPKIDGYLASSVVDLDDGNGSAAILVQVPSARFEQTVTELGRIGEVTRQEMLGRQVAPPDMPREERALAEAQAALSPIDVALSARPPAPPREETPIEQALDKATGMALAIASGAIVAAGVILPVATTALVVYLVWSLVLRRLRLRWEEPG